MSDTWDPWNYRASVAREGEAASMVGYHVHAVDGDIGKIDESTTDVDARSIVVDTGPWIFGRRVVLPAGTVERVDDVNEMVYVDLTKDQIKDSPALVEGGSYDDPLYRSNVGMYYGGLYL